MKFKEFEKYQPRQVMNVHGLVCEDDFLVEESRSIWDRIFGGDWTFEKLGAREFDDIPVARLMDEALTPSLFSRKRVLMVIGAEKLTKSRREELGSLQAVRDSSLKVVLVTSNRKASDAWGKRFPAVEIDPLKPAEVARWIVDRYRLGPDVARHLVENVGTDLYLLDSEISKLQTFAGDRSLDVRDIDILILRSERFGTFELDDAVLARDYRKAVMVVGAMLEEGMEPLIVLSRIARVWRQLFVGKALVGKRSPKEVASLATVPVWKAADFVGSCRKFEWKDLAGGFRQLLSADRALKGSTPNPEGYLDVMLWKLIG